MLFYLIGIKGSGMSALAHLLLDDEYDVRGLDKKKIKDLYSEDLIKRNVVIDDIDSKEYLKADVIIIGHSFINEKLKEELDNNYKLWFEYHEFLDFYIEREKLVSICGSHGKTTLVNMLKTLIPNSSYLSGDGSARKIENEQFFFLESCEYKNHYLQYKPKEVIITNIDYDHVDYFKNENEYIDSFNEFSKKASKVYINIEDANKVKVKNIVTFGIDNRADYYAEIIDKNKDFIKAKLFHKINELGEYTILNLGNHFLELFIALIAFMHQHNMTLEKVQNNISNFIPSRQRFNQLKVGENYLNIDYAHHPSQIVNNYEICREKFPNLIKIGIFKGDRLSRISYFKDEIKKALNNYDFAFVLPLPNMENNLPDEAKILCDDKIKYIDDISRLKDYFNKEKKYSISLMSSKTLVKETEYLKSLF